MDDARLETLLSKQAILEVIYRYCRGLDRMDRDLALSVWHPGGTADYGEEMYVGTGEGFIDWVWQQHAGFERHSHQITNVLIEVDSERASSEAYVTVALRTTVRDRIIETVSRGRYLDRWSRRDNIWAIDHRIHITDFTSTHDLPTSEWSAGSPRSRRDRSDPSYEVLGA